MLEQYCSAYEVNNVQFLKPLEKFTQDTDMFKRGRMLTVTNDDSVLIKAELGASLGATPKANNLALRDPPAVDAPTWDDATDRINQLVFYTRCAMLQLAFAGDYRTIKHVEWCGLDFWCEAKATHLPAALDAGLQVVCAMDVANTYVPFRIKTMRLCRPTGTATEADLLWATPQRVVCSGRVLSADRQKTTAHVRVCVPAIGYDCVFEQVEFANVASLLPGECVNACCFDWH